MYMSYDHPKPIRMHALTLFNDMRRPKLPQRPRGSPGAFTFFKIFEHTGTNQYTSLPAGATVSRCRSWSCARRQRQMRRFEPLHRTGLRRAPPPGDNPLPRQFVSPDLSGNFVSPGIFSGRSVSPEWQPYHYTPLLRPDIHLWRGLKIIKSYGDELLCHI